MSPNTKTVWPEFVVFDESYRTPLVDYALSRLRAHIAEHSNCRHDDRRMAFVWYIRPSDDTPLELSPAAGFICDDTMADLPEQVPQPAFTVCSTALSIVQLYISTISNELPFYMPTVLVDLFYWMAYREGYIPMVCCMYTEETRIVTLTELLWIPTTELELVTDD